MSDKTIKITDDNFQAEVLDSKVPVLVDFWAPWCGPCLAIGPTIEQIATDYEGKAVVGKMNVDENANMPATYGVRSIPFIAVFKDGQVVDSVVGSVPKQKLQEVLDKAL